jgi:hypothetical protein
MSTGDPQFENVIVSVDSTDIEIFDSVESCGKEDDVVAVVDVDVDVDDEDDEEDVHDSVDEEWLVDVWSGVAGDDWASVL